jgi:ABC-2 type transport system ATP-binding protein
MSNLVIETKELTKKYGDFTAVDTLNLTVQEGEVFGLLGPNGAGKTTTILMLLGLTEPTSGSIQVLGLDPALKPLSVKSNVGYLPDSVGFYDEMTARENLSYIARLNGLPRREISDRIDAVLARVKLSHVADQRVGTFSRGMQQRLGVADVLIKQPGLIIMDEPTQGLDPEGAREFLVMIQELKEEGITILLSSHLLHQVQIVCDRVGLFNRGQLVLEGTVYELAKQILGRAYRILATVEKQTPAIEEKLKTLPGVVNVEHLNGHVYEVETEDDLRADVAEAVIAAGGRLVKLDVEAQNLEEIYEHYFKEVEHGITS